MTDWIERHDGFLDTVEEEHNKDPDDWHRKMVAPPKPRSTHCYWCGVSWKEITDGSTLPEEDPSREVQ